MTAATLGSDAQEALQEIVNVAMGQAADSLARLFQAFVKLPVPRVRHVEAEHVLENIGEMLGEHGDIAAVRQGFSGPMSGEALVIFDAAGCANLAAGFGYSPDAHNEDELLLDVANVLNGACLGGIARQLGLDVSFSPPSILFSRGQLDRLLEPARALPWRHALLVEVNFRLEDRAFRCHVLVFYPEAAMGRLNKSIDAFLAELG